MCRFESRDESVDSTSDDECYGVIEEQPTQHCRLTLYRDDSGGSFDGVNALPLQRSREVLVLGITDRSDVAPWLDAFVDDVVRASYLIYENSGSTGKGSVVINFQSQSAADKFYKRYHN
ncbi:hypothetical protein FOZ63_010912, partial [Perkinsus olseni]